MIYEDTMFLFTVHTRPSPSRIGGFLIGAVRAWFHLVLSASYGQPVVVACGLGRGVVGKCTKLNDITKLNNIDFFMKCFTADFSQFCSTTVGIWLMCGWLSVFPSFRSISGIALKFLNFLRSYVLSSSVTSEATHVLNF